MPYKPNAVVNTAHFPEFLLVFPLENTSFQLRNNNKPQMLGSLSSKKLLVVQMSWFTEHLSEVVQSSPLSSHSVTQAAIPAHSFSSQS